VTDDSCLALVLVLAQDAKREHALSNALTPASQTAAWSPEGSRIAFARAVPGAGRSETANIYLANADGTGDERTRRDRESPSVLVGLRSPDRLHEHRGAKLKGASLWILNVKGGGMRRLTRAAFEDADRAWHPITK
jgi:hypothetical protein